MAQYADVVLPLALPRNLTYKIPEALCKEITIGHRVVVQVGKRKLYSGIVAKIHSNPPKDVRVRDILEIEDSHPIVTSAQLKLWEWMSSYYMCSQGEIMAAALPAGLKLESETQILLNDNIDIDESELSDDQFLIIEALRFKSPLSISEVNEITNKKNSLKIVHSLLGLHLILLPPRVK